MLPWKRQCNVDSIPGRVSEERGFYGQESQHIHQASTHYKSLKTLCTCRVHSSHLHFGSPQKLEKFVSKRPKRGVVLCTTRSRTVSCLRSRSSSQIFCKRGTIDFCQAAVRPSSIFRWLHRVCPCQINKLELKRIFRSAVYRRKENVQEQVRSAVGP